MTAEPELFLSIVRRFDAPAERVFDAWINPGVTRKWLFTSPESDSNSAELDARVGGRWTMTDRRGGAEYTASGEYLSVDRPRRLAFTFAMPQFSPNSDTLEVDLTPDGSGCVMTFTQRGVDVADELRQLSPGEKGGSEEGWSAMFDRLAEALG